MREAWRAMRPPRPAPRRRSAKKMTPASIAFGAGSSPTRASVITPSVPSDPQIRSTQSIPGRSR